MVVFRYFSFSLLSEMITIIVITIIFDLKKVTLQFKIITERTMINLFDYRFIMRPPGNNLDSSDDRLHN